jgi:hypothetical protein
MATMTATSTPTNTPTPVGGAQLAETGTTCSQYLNGTATTLGLINYAVSGGKISGDNPGVFFYYATITAVANGAQTITITQETDQGGTTYLFHVQNDSVNQVNLYNASCNGISTTVNVSNPEAITVTLPSSATVGQVYVVSVKYSPKSIVGLAAPSPTTVNYFFDLYGAQSVATQTMVLKKPGT